MGSEPQPYPLFFFNTETPFPFSESNILPIYLNLLVPSQNFVSTHWDETLYEMQETENKHILWC